MCFENKSHQYICSLKNNLSFYSKGKSQEEMINCYTQKYTIFCNNLLLLLLTRTCLWFNSTQDLKHLTRDKTKNILLLHLLANTTMFLHSSTLLSHYTSADTKNYLNLSLTSLLLSNEWHFYLSYSACMHKHEDVGMCCSQGM